MSAILGVTWSSRFVSRGGDGTCSVWPDLARCLARPVSPRVEVAELGEVGEVGEIGEIGKVEVGEIGEVGEVGEVGEIGEVEEVGTPPV